MLLQAKKLFFFRFPAGTIVMVLEILLCCLGHEEVVQESCSKTVSAWMKVGDLQKPLQKCQDQFLVNLLDCSKEIHKQFPEAPKSDNCETFKSVIPSTVLAPMIDTEIPKVIDESTSLATKERLALLSVYLVFLCHETGYLSCRAANLSSVIKHPEYRQKFERLLTDFKPVLDFLNWELIGKWKSEDSTILQNNADAQINMLNQFSKRLKEVAEEIYNHVYQNSESNLWSFLSVFLTVVVVLVGVKFCVTWLQILLSIFIIIAFGGAGVYFAFNSTLLYSNTDKFSRETVAQLSQLKTDTEALHDKIVKLKTSMEKSPYGYDGSVDLERPWLTAPRLVTLCCSAGCGCRGRCGTRIACCICCR